MTNTEQQTTEDSEFGECSESLKSLAEASAASLMAASSCRATQIADQVAGDMSWLGLTITKKIVGLVEQCKTANELADLLTTLRDATSRQLQIHDDTTL